MCGGTRQLSFARGRTARWRAVRRRPLPATDWGRSTSRKAVKEKPPYPRGRIVHVTRLSVPYDECTDDREHENRKDRRQQDPNAQSTRDLQRNHGTTIRTSSKYVSNVSTLRLLRRSFSGLTRAVLRRRVSILDFSGRQPRSVWATWPQPSANCWLGASDRSATVPGAGSRRDDRHRDGRGTDQSIGRTSEQ